MKSNQIWMIVGIVIVVAVIASVATVSLTGNVISVQKSSTELNKCVSSCQKDCSSLPYRDRNLCKSKCVNSCPKYDDVYTKAEIDAFNTEIDDTITKIYTMMDGKTTNENVLNMLNNCNIYSVSVPTANRTVRGNDICAERNAGKCIFTVNYANANDAINGGNSPTGSNLGIIESCAWGPYKSTDAVAYCCAG